MVRIELDIGAFELFPSRTIEGFGERLVQSLPGLANHGCCYHQAGGSAIEA
jgi:cyanophycin synthetase